MASNADDVMSPSYSLIGTESNIDSSDSRTREITDSSRNSSPVGFSSWSRLTSSSNGTTANPTLRLNEPAFPNSDESIDEESGVEEAVDFSVPNKVELVTKELIDESDVVEGAAPDESELDEIV